MKYRRGRRRRRPPPHLDHRPKGFKAVGPSSSYKKPFKPFKRGQVFMVAYVMRNGKLIEKSLAPPLIQTFGEAPHVISDSMPHLRHMADGNYYDSKAKFREVTKAHNCVEIGNDPAILRPRKPVTLDRGKRHRDIKTAIDQLKARS